MRRSIALTASMFLVTVSGMFFGAHAAKPLPFQCVECDVRSGCWRCVGGGKADNCPNVSCESCTVQGLCDPEIGSVPRRPARVTFDEKTIRDIAGVHPRFAATLAKLNKSSFEGGRYRVSWTPVPLDAQSIEFYLAASPETIPSYQKHIKRAKRINRLIERGELAPIVYSVYVENPNSDAPALKLEVIKGSDVDPAYSFLEVRLAQGVAALNSTFNATDWVIR